MRNRRGRMDSSEEDHDDKLKLQELDTKGCCLICFKSVEFEGSSQDCGGENQVPLDKLCRYLKLDMGAVIRRLVSSSSSSSDGAASFKSTTVADEDERLLKVSLCEGCRGTTTRFSGLARQLEDIQMEMDGCLKVIQKCIAEADGNDQRVDGFHSLMTTNKESLTRLEIVDELRSKIFLTDSAFSSNDYPDELLESISIIKCRSEFRKMNGTQLDSSVEATPSPTTSKGAFSDDDDEYTEAETEANGAVNLGTVKFESESFEDENEDESTYEDLIIHNRNSHPDPFYFPQYDDDDNSNTPESDFRTKNEVMPTELPPTTPNGSQMISPDDHDPLPQRHLTINGGRRRLMVRLIKNSSPTKNSTATPSPIPNQAIPQQHQRRTSSKFDRRTPGKYTCVRCSKQFNTREGVGKHYDSVHLKLRHKCTECEKDFHSRASLQRHYRMAHLHVRYRCHECNSIFTLKTNLRQHQRMTRCGKVGNRQVILL